MSELVEINNVALGIKEIKGKRVITFKDIDKVHERPNGTARKAFNRNKNRFIYGEDYYLITRETPGNFAMSVSWTLENIPPRGIIYITESGYLMIAKVFDDNLAWDVQRKLVNNYFRFKNISEDNMLNQTLNTLNTTLSVIQEELKQLKEQQKQQEIAAKKPEGKKSPSLFAKSMFSKYRAIEEYFGYSRKELYHKLYLTLQRAYEVDLDQLKDSYCMENGLSDCFLMDAIESRKDLRTKLQYIVNQILDKWGIDVEEDIDESFDIQ